jgi:ketosteroid isomerase-like protein
VPVALQPLACRRVFVPPASSRAVSVTPASSRSAACTAGILPALLFLLLPTFLFADEAAQSLAQSELAFAHTASEKGIKDAFLAYLAEDSVLFRPRAVPGKQWMSGRPATKGVLIWEPSYAEVSGAGDLGFTTGPYSYKASPEDTSVSYGQFFTIWKKQSDGIWNVFLDAGVAYEKEKPATPLVTKAGKSAVVSNEVRESEHKNVLDAESRFSAGMYSENAIRLFQKDFGGDCTFKPDASGISQSADLAYVYGTFGCDTNSGIYVRMWRKEGEWKVALDYRNE